MSDGETVGEPFRLERERLERERLERAEAVASRLLQRLCAEPQEFEFFQAIRLLEAEQITDADRAGLPRPPGVGVVDEGPADATGIRFRSTATVAFPQGAITRIERGPRPADGTAAEPLPGRGRIDVDLACFGLVGPAGRLPQHYTALVIERLRHHRDATLRDFLDIFVHRMAGLLYRAWGAYRPSIQHERRLFTGRGAAWDQADGDPRDAVTAVVAALCGLATRGLARRLAESDDAVLFHAAHFARQTRSAEAIELLLTDLYGAPVEVVPFVGRWLELEVADRTVLPGAEQREGQHARLGVDAVVGRRVWDLASTFEVRVGPLPMEAFRSRLPGSARLRALCDLLRLYAGPQYEIRVRLVLAAEDVPRLQLGRDARLGWTSWLAAGSSREDRGDAVFRVTV